MSRESASAKLPIAQAFVLEKSLAARYRFIEHAGPQFGRIEVKGRRCPVAGNRRPSEFALAKLALTPEALLDQTQASCSPQDVSNSS